MHNSSSLIIVTDLDGTLLDHYTYKFDAALPALEHLKRLDIPLILNSSKTAPEIISLRKALNNTHPFIVENGAGIYIPIAGKQNDFEVISFGRERKSILKVLKTIRDNFNLPFTSFNDMSVEELMAETGLTMTKAEQAKQREFTEPLKWHGNDQQWGVFCTEIARSGLSAVQGGRFISVSSQVDKGQALKWIAEYYQQLWAVQPIIVALGDSDNDAAMLSLADHSVLIRSPAHDLPKLDIKNLLVTKEVGPIAWNESVISLLQQYNLIDNNNNG